MPGVKFTVRTLNKIQRAKRDYPVAEKVIEYSELADEYFALLPKGWAEVQAARVKLAKLRAASEDERDDAEIALAAEAVRVIEASIVDTPKSQTRRNVVDLQAQMVRDEHFKPAAIRASLVKIDGLEIDGKPATAELLLASTGADYDELIDEIYLACEAAAGLSADQQKNSQSLTTSTEPVVGDPTASSVTVAAN